MEGSWCASMLLAAMRAMALPNIVSDATQMLQNAPSSQRPSPTQLRPQGPVMEWLPASVVDNEVESVGGDLDKGEEEEDEVG